MSQRIAIDIGIVVTDMERSLSFYRDLLGLPVIAEITTALIGKGRMVQLKHSESLIKLVQLDTSPTEQSSKGISQALGYRYITLLISDIDTTMTRLTQANVTVTISITQLDNDAKIAMVEDPDGNIVEFVQES